MIFKFSSSKTLVAIAVASSVMLAGCTATATTSTDSSIQTNTTVANVVNTPADLGETKITLEIDVSYYSKVASYRRPFSDCNRVRLQLIRTIVIFDTREN